MRHAAIAAIFPVFGLVACAEQALPAASPPTLTSATMSEACRGKQFDATEADPRCLRREASEPAPAKDAIAVTLHADSIVKSGRESSLVVEMRNVTSAPITLDVDAACAFQPIAKNDQATSFEDECHELCARPNEPSVLHVTLDPDGVIVARIPFYATARRVSLLHDKCDESSLGGLPAGRYDLAVTLPWKDGDAQREAHASITVAP